MGCPGDATTTPTTAVCEEGSEMTESLLSPSPRDDDGGTPPAPANARNANKRPRRRSEAANILRRPSMQTRAQQTKCQHGTPIPIVVVLATTDSDQASTSAAPNPKPLPWEGDLPLLPPLQKKVTDERQQELARPQGVERDEYQEAHLQQALGCPSTFVPADSDRTFIPIPTGSRQLSDEAYRQLYSRTLVDSKPGKHIRYRSARHDVTQHYCLDQHDAAWLATHNEAYPQPASRAVSQPATSSSSSATAVEDDDAMEIDLDQDEARLIKTEPLPDGPSAGLRSPLADSQPECTQGDTPMPDMSAELVAGSSRLSSVPETVGTEPSFSEPPVIPPAPPSIEHQEDEYGFLSEDELEFSMEYLEAVAFGDMRSVSPSFERLLESVQREFPQRICAMTLQWWQKHACDDARRKSYVPSGPVKCICSLLRVVYPHWLLRRRERNGRSLMARLQIPQDVAEDGEDPYIVFRDTEREWRNLQTAQPQRSRNPRRDAERAQKLKQEAELMKHLPKRIHLTVKPPPPAPTPVATVTPTPPPRDRSRSSSNARTPTAFTTKAGTPKAGTPGASTPHPLASNASTPTAASTPAPLETGSVPPSDVSSREASTQPALDSAAFAPPPQNVVVQYMLQPAPPPIRGPGRPKGSSGRGKSRVTQKGQTAVLTHMPTNIPSLPMMQAPPGFMRGPLPLWHPPMLPPPPPLGFPMPPLPPGQAFPHPGFMYPIHHAAGPAPKPRPQPKTAAGSRPTPTAPSKSHPVGLPGMHVFKLSGDGEPPEPTTVQPVSVPRGRTPVLSKPPPSPYPGAVPTAGPSMLKGTAAHKAAMMTPPQPGYFPRAAGFYLPHQPQLTVDVRMAETVSVSASRNDLVDVGDMSPLTQPESEEEMLPSFDLDEPKPPPAAPSVAPASASVSAQRQRSERSPLAVKRRKTAHSKAKKDGPDAKVDPRDPDA
ncbi:hypothetical protein BKA62DRAFT_685426 [Auriculariales sp. MPI-PUGE-AT-0066]|nr:hypothetical protein BKA62DRAFT_685426 [Auriculariales sp. MPI-PUGE-AT-0066]